MSTRSTLRRLLSVGLALSVACAACGGDSGESNSSTPAPDTPADPTEAVVPAPGGDVTFALEAETAGGYCLPEAQLAVSGLEVARSIYDPLTTPSADGSMVPYLAESVEPSDDFTTWTIKLRDGVVFHDSTALDAQVVKNNLDAYTGNYEGRAAPLSQFITSDIESVEVADPLTVIVTTKRPWVAFDTFLFFGGRFGIMAQAQLDSENCAEELIGTGPFMLDEWVVNEELTTTRNPDYWQTDERGVQLPYLDSITFKISPEANQRVSALEAGDGVELLHTADTAQIVRLRDLARSGDISLVESNEFAEVQWQMLNMSKPPFDNRNARLAFATAIDLELLNEISYDGILEQATGPFSPGSLGHLDDPGRPPFDPEAAADFAAAYEADTGQELSIELGFVSNESNTLLAQEMQGQLAEAGIDSNLDPVGDQATFVSTALGGDYEVISFRSFTGGDPDRHYTNLRSDSPVNLMRVKDAEIDRLLDEGRSEGDTGKRQEIYEAINRRMAEEVYSFFVANTNWAIAGVPELGGVLDTPLPGGESPFPGLAEGFPTVGLHVNTAPA